MDENPKFLEEYSKVDKIIPQSDLKIKAFAEVHLADLKKEMGIFKYIESGKMIDWERYSECYARKIWKNFLRCNEFLGYINSQELYKKQDSK